MKKQSIIFLYMTIVLFGITNFGYSGIIGHDVIDRSSTDEWATFSVIDLSLKFSEYGKISSWSLYAEEVGEIYLQIFRNVSGTTYAVTGQNYFSVGKKGVNTFHIFGNDQLEFEPNDYVGWTFVNSAIIPFDRDLGNFVDWSNEGEAAIGIGTTIDFNFPTGNHDRTYSIAANTIPIPGTLSLLGFGLISLLAIKQRKTE